MKVAFVSTLDAGRLGAIMKKYMEKEFNWEISNYIFRPTYLDREGEYTVVPTTDKMALMAVKQNLRDSDFLFLRWIGDYEIGYLDLDKIVTKDNALFKVHGSEARSLGIPETLIEWKTNWKYLPLTLVSCMDMSVSKSLNSDSIYHIERPLDMSIMPRSAVCKDNLILSHSPTNNGVLKGTDLLKETMKEIEGIELRMIENMPYEEALQAKRTSSIVFDQFIVEGIGIYGMSAAEAWYLRLPVLTELSQEAYMFHPELHDFVIEVTPTTLLHKLEVFKENPEEFWELGNFGREYVKHVHDPIKIARQYKALIEMILHA